jgi:hypothetical protein
VNLAQSQSRIARAGAFRLAAGELEARMEQFFQLVPPFDPNCAAPWELMRLFAFVDRAIAYDDRACLDEAMRLVRKVHRRQIVGTAPPHADRWIQYYRWRKSGGFHARKARRVEAAEARRQVRPTRVADVAVEAPVRASAAVVHLDEARRRLRAARARQGV